MHRLRLSYLIDYQNIVCVVRCAAHTTTNKDSLISGSFLFGQIIYFMPLHNKALPKEGLVLAWWEKGACFSRMKTVIVWAYR